MQNQLQVFKNKDFGEVRVMEIDGLTWFVGKDIAEILGYSNISKAITAHVDNEDRTAVMIPTSQNGKLVSRTHIINESGLYSLILSSKLPQAKAFKRWVTTEVLPTIRKHGAYATADTLDEMYRSPKFTEALIRKLADEREKTEVLAERLEVLAPKARYHDLVLQCDTPIPISIIAKDYSMSAVLFNRLLHSLKIQYSVGKTWLLYKEHDNKGYTISKTYYVNSSSAAIHTYWTQKGRKFIYDFLKWHGILPNVERKELN